TRDRYAKEVKLFGLGRYFIDRYRLIGERYYGSQRSQVVRRYLTGFLWGNLSTIATSVTYLYVALQAIAGRLTLGDLTLYTTAAQSVQNSIQGILGGFSGMYEHTLYLSNIVGLLDTRTVHRAPDNPAQLRAKIGGMFQDYVTYQATAAENIGLGNLGALTDHDAVVKASRQAGSDSLIAGLPQGYETALGKWFDAGVNLSGGEWQK